MSDDEPRMDDVPSVEDCADVLWAVQSFLDGELSQARADEIRAHLMECEHCLEFYDSETIITELVRRCCRNAAKAPSPELRVRVSSLHVSVS